jgi:hypothetical protein
MSNRFSDVTKRIQERLPYWFRKMRTDETSIGAQFLNVFGLAIEDVEYMVNYIYEQTSIRNIDENQIDIIYKLFIPASINDTYNIHIESDNHILSEVDRLDQFLVDLNQEGVSSNIDFPNPFFVDFQKHVIYVRRDYDSDENFKYGKVSIRIEKDNNIIYEDVVKLELHHLWNFFDELGLLLDTPRLRGEVNSKYKERLLDVFRHPANASLNGLINGIGRSLGLRRNYTWDNGELDYIIEHKGVIINSIEIDNEKPKDYIVRHDKDNDQIVLKGSEAYSEISRNISYIHGFTMHQLHNTKDLEIQNQIDKPGKPLLEYIKEELKVKAPIYWGYFIWDEAIWDTINEHTDFIPPRLDGRIL